MIRTQVCFVYVLRFGMCVCVCVSLYLAVSICLDHIRISMYFSCVSDLQRIEEMILIDYFGNIFKIPRKYNRITEK